MCVYVCIYIYIYIYIYISSCHVTSTDFPISCYLSIVHRFKQILIVVYLFITTQYGHRIYIYICIDFISGVFQLTPTQGHNNVDWSAKTYNQQHWMPSRELTQTRTHIWLNIRDIVISFVLQYRYSVFSPSTFCPTLGHHQGMMYYKSEDTAKNVCVRVCVYIYIYIYINK